MPKSASRAPPFFEHLSLNDHATKEAIQNQRPFKASPEAQKFAMQMYVSGAANFLEVVVAQVTAFQTGITLIGINVQSQQAAINLVRALGGGWSTDLLPARVFSDNPLKPL